MIRRYRPDLPVPRQRIDRLITNAVRAPSAGFSQGWHFLVLDEPDGVAAYWSATISRSPRSTDPADPWLTGMRTAPAIIVVFSDRRAYEERYARSDKAARVDTSTNIDERWPVPYWHLDAAMAALLILLSAVDQELGACFFGVPSHRVEAVKARFGAPVEFVPIGAITLGFPDPDYRATPAARRPITDVVSYGSYRSAVSAPPTGPAPTTPSPGS